MAKGSEKRPRPSYEDGKLRDPSIAKRFSGLSRDQLKALIKKAVPHKS